jgi:hypothetical protein
MLFCCEPHKTYQYTVWQICNILNVTPHMYLPLEIKWLQGLQKI